MHLFLIANVVTTGMARAQVKFQGLTSEQLRAAARRPVADGGLGRDLRAPGEARSGREAMCSIRSILVPSSKARSP